MSHYGSVAYGVGETFDLVPWKPCSCLPGILCGACRARGKTLPFPVVPQVWPIVCPPIVPAPIVTTTEPPPVTVRTPPRWYLKWRGAPTSAEITGHYWTPRGETWTRDRRDGHAFASLHDARLVRDLWFRRSTVAIVRVGRRIGK